MTLLKHIQTSLCPFCGTAEVYYEKRDLCWKHSNGVIPEERKFACGQAIEHNGNFREDVPSLHYTCGWSTSAINKIEKHNTAIHEALDKLKSVANLNKTLLASLTSLLSNAVKDVPDRRKFK